MGAMPEVCPQATAPGQASKDCGYAGVCQGTWVVACQELSLGLLQSYGTQECKPPGFQNLMIKGCSLCGSCKNQATRYV